MDRDRSLDEFVGGGSDDGDDGGDDDSVGVDDDVDDATGGAGPEDAEDINAAAITTSDETDEPETVKPATATYRWEPEGAECAVCGAIVERLWSGEEGRGQVCADCKDW
ncbi:MAG: hypothetical protein ABEJ97_09205 [Halobellus sp.]